MFLHYEDVRESRKALSEMCTISTAKFVHADDVVGMVSGDQQAVLEYFQLEGFLLWKEMSIMPLLFKIVFY